MAFHDVRFDTTIAAGATGGPSHNTTVTQTAGGQERRQINWAGVRHKYDVGTAIRTTSDMATIKAFHNARRGRAYAFRFKDWMDYTLGRQAIGTTDGATATFQIYKRYTSGSYHWDRDITKPVSGTVRCWVDGTERTLGGGGTGFTVALLTGIVTLGATLAALSAKTVEVACEFDVPVRFDSDEMAAEIKDADIVDWPSVTLIEVDE